VGIYKSDEDVEEAEMQLIWCIVSTVQFFLSFIGSCALVGLFCLVCTSLVSS
jgi:hypothetical protein